MISSKPKEINLSITQTDVGILYIIQHELLQASNVDFAGVIVKHPLTNECWMRINSTAKPLGTIKRATESATTMANELKELFKSELKVS